MSKRARRVHRLRANVPSRARPTAAANRPRPTLAKSDPGDTRPLLARILDTPHLAQVVPQLRPEVLHKLIERCGLEDCGDLVALASPAQLTSVLDIDLWRGRQPGGDEHLDAERFAVWLNVLVDSGAAVAARVIASMDVDLVAVALAQHVRIFDVAARSRPDEMDREIQAEIDEPEATISRDRGAGLSCEISGYLIEARRDDAWDAIVTVLAALDAEYPDALHRVLGGCRRLSNSTPEIDGLDDLLTDPEQAMFDVVVNRERRRHAQGYATPAEARAFLRTSRQPPVSREGGPDVVNVVDIVSRAYFRAIRETAAKDEGGGAGGAVGRSPAPGWGPRSEKSEWGPRSQKSDSSAEDMHEAAGADGPTAAVASLMDVLVAEGVVQQPPRALLQGSREESRPLALIESRMRFVHDGDFSVYAARNEELAFLANALMAGCSIQARPFTAKEASDAAVAVCNLGLENWASVEAAALPEDFLVDHDLVSVFQVGWRVLYQQVCMYAAEELIAVLGRLTCADSEIQAGLDALRRELGHHWRSGEPWRARDALDVVTSLDMPAWATLLCLLDECPVIHAALVASQTSGTRSVSASAFEFISKNSQIASVRVFMQSLPATLAG